MFIVKTVSGLERFSTEQNPVIFEGLKSRNSYSTLELLKMAIYRKILVKLVARRLPR
jgi:hypothetical protein